jgi:PAS domain-containing protein
LIRGSALLELVRDKIAALDLPAYVKDSELRYVAVNAAFAQLHNLVPESFIGRNDREILGVDPDDYRDDRERRVLVFGEEEELHLRTEPTGPARLLHIERFFDDDDRMYLFGFMEESPASAVSAGPSPAALPSAAVFQAVLEQYPIATYFRGSDHRLLFANGAYAEMVGRPIGQLIGRTEHENFPNSGSSISREIAACSNAASPRRFRILSFVPTVNACPCSAAPAL